MSSGETSEETVPAGRIAIRTYEGPGHPSVETVVDVAAGERREIVIAPHR